MSVHNQSKNQHRTKSILLLKLITMYVYSNTIISVTIGLGKIYGLIFRWHLSPCKTLLTQWCQRGVPIGWELFLLPIRHVIYPYTYAFVYWSDIFPKSFKIHHVASYVYCDYTSHATTFKQHCYCLKLVLFNKVLLIQTIQIYT